MILHKRRKDGLIVTWSGDGYYIIQNETGNKYTEAIDARNSKYTYSESNEKIREPSDDTN